MADRGRALKTGDRRRETGNGRKGAGIERLETVNGRQWKTAGKKKLDLI
jgi:hypothetical protein